MTKFMTSWTSVVLSHSVCKSDEIISAEYVRFVITTFLLPFNYKFTKESSSENFLNRLRFDRTMVINHFILL